MQYPPPAVLPRPDSMPSLPDTLQSLPLAEFGADHSHGGALKSAPLPDGELPQIFPLCCDTLLSNRAVHGLLQAGSAHRQSHQCY